MLLQAAVFLKFFVEVVLYKKYIPSKQAHQNSKTKRCLSHLHSFILRPMPGELAELRELTSNTTHDEHGAGIGGKQ